MFLSEGDEVVARTERDPINIWREILNRCQDLFALALVSDG
jgi:hypothetical protein